jgi:hypothetical protein
MPMDVSKVNRDSLYSDYQIADADEIDFEEIEKEMGKMLIFVSRDRRNYYHLQSGVLDNEYKEQVKKNVETYRGWGVLAFTAGKCALQLVKLGTLTQPENGSIFSIPTKDIVKGADFSDHIADAIKEVYNNSVGANRTEASAQADYLKSIAEQKRQEHQKYIQDEGDSVRKFEQARQKRNDFELSMARGG